jgi:hypothetical protein
LLIVPLGRHPLEATVDHVQQVVEVVGQPCRELADGFHLLRLPKLLLALAPVRHVELAGEEVDDLAFGVVYRTHEHRVPERRAVPAVVQDLQCGGPAFKEGFPELPDVIRVGARALQEAAVAAEDFAFLVAGQVQEGVVGEHDGCVVLARVGQDHRHPGHLDGGEEDATAVAQVRIGDGALLPVAQTWTAERLKRPLVHAAACRLARALVSTAGVFRRSLIIVHVRHEVSNACLLSRVRSRGGFAEDCVTQVPLPSEPIAFALGPTHAAIELSGP